MQRLKKRLFKVRLMSAVLATIELANAGMTSYAMMSSDYDTSIEEYEYEEEVSINSSEEVSINSAEEVHINNAKEMANVAKTSPEKLLRYLQIGSTVEELERYYDDRTLDKSRKDVANFNLLDEGIKKSFFDFIIEFISEKPMEDFKELPTEVRTEFFEYVISKKYDLKEILYRVGISKDRLCITSVSDAVNLWKSVVPPRIAGIIFANICIEYNPFIHAMVNGSKCDLIRATAVDNFDWDNGMQRRMNGMPGPVFRTHSMLLEDIDQYAVHRSRGSASFGCTLIEYAALIGNADAFKYLLMNKVKITQNTMIYAIMGGNEEIIQIIKQGNFNYSLVLNDIMMLRGLASANREDILDWLQTNFGDISQENIVTACCLADNLSLLVKVFKGVPDELLNEGLNISAASQNTEMMKFFLDKGVDANSKDKYGIPMLIKAVQNRDVNIAQLLLEKGADVNLADRNGVTALIKAVRKRDVDITKLLLEKGADVNLTDKNGVTALSEARKKRNEEIIGILIANGARE